MNKIINKAPIIGFIRYSQKINFVSNRDVFEPEYFEYRFKIFKEVTLKSFQQQKNNNFVLLLLHSENLELLNNVKKTNEISNIFYYLVKFYMYLFKKKNINVRVLRSIYYRILLLQK